MRLSRRIFPAALALVLSTLCLCRASAEPQLRSVGVARVDITPDYPIRMNGFLVRKVESVGVRQQVWAKALAIGTDGEAPVVLITVDTLGIPHDMHQEVAKRLQAKRAVQADHLCITASHSHTAPMINGCAPNIFGEPIPPDAQAHIDRYTLELTDKLEAVALAALDDRRERSLEWGIGIVNFAKNRRDKAGPVDHDLPMLVVREPDGRERAIYVSYACHCVTLSEPMIGGDWAGYAQQQIEKRYPNAVAMVSIGCAGDQNPISDVTGDRYDIALGQGEQIAVEVDRLLTTQLRAISGALTVTREVIDLPLAQLPTREEFSKLAEQQTPPGYHARVQLAKLDRGEKLREKIDYPIVSWAFGDSLAMVFLAGEVVSEYGLRIKSELDSRKLWVNAYANACPCYIPSEKVLKAGGYEGAGAMVYYDQPSRFAPGLEEKILDTVVGQLSKTFPPLVVRGKGLGTRPRAPEQSLKLMRTHSDLQVELVVAEPLVASPVAVDFGPDGKVWVAEMFDYPSGTDGNSGPGGRIRLLHSSREDGTLDTSTIFLDGIPFPTGVSVWRKGVLVCAAPDIMYAEDSDGDGRADIVRKLFSGFGTDNYQARVNSLEIGLDGWIYGSCGLFGGSIKSFASDERLELGDRDFRMHPDTGVIEPAVGRTQQGRVRDDFGNWFGCNNSALCFHYPLADHYTRRNPFAPPPPGASMVPARAEDQRLIPASEHLQLFKLSGGSGHATAACGLGIYRDSLLGEGFTGNAFTCEPVNLLVHRLALSQRDSTFSGRRPDAEVALEFLSSTDTWFRPVQARTAPDGSLWILDMYRFVIEHPRWIPPDTLANVDVRAGSSLGRIYRVRSRSAKLRPWPRLDGMSPEELVAALDSANGWQRDMAMQLLVWNKENSGASAAEPLRALSQNATAAKVRLQALATLAQLDQIQITDVDRALHDSHPGVRRWALTLAEPFAVAEDAAGANLLRQVIALSSDDDGQVRLQAACSLGAWRQPTAAGALARIALAHPHDKILQAAVLSSLRRENISAFVAELSSSDVENALGQIAPQTLPVAFALADPDTALRIVQVAIGDDRSQGLAAWQWTTLSALMDHLDKHAEFASLLADRTEFAQLGQTLKQAHATVRDDAVLEEVRIAATAVLNRAPQTRADDRQLLVALLNPRSSAGLQLAGVRALLRGKEAGVANDLLHPWKQLSPQVKAAALAGLLSRSEWTKSLLEQLESAQISAAELGANERQRLLSHSDLNIRARAEKVLAGQLNPDRAEVLNAYATVSTLNGHSQRGRELFRKNCVTCHRLGDLGVAVGPDLAPLAHKPIEFFLQEILDPNRNLDSRYMSYTAVTDNGRTISGLLAAETATAITMRGADAKEETLQRDELEQLTSTRSSLMPEGLERLLPPQDMADVITFVRTSAEQPAEVAEQSLAAGELARDILNDALPNERRLKLVTVAQQSAAEVITAMAANMPHDEKEEYRRIPWIWRVAIAAGQAGDPNQVRQVIECSLPRDGEPLRDWQAVVIGGGVINGLGLRGDWPRIKIEPLLADSPSLQKRWQAGLAASVTMADDARVRAGTRYDALRMVAMLPWNSCRNQLVRYLGKEVNAELQMGAVSGLADVEDIQAARMLVEHYADLTANNRRFAITGLLKSEERQLLLLDAVESNRIPSSELDEPAQHILLNSKNKQQATRAAKLFAK